MSHILKELCVKFMFFKLYFRNFLPVCTIFTSCLPVFPGLPGLSASIGPSGQIMCPSVPKSNGTLSFWSTRKELDAVFFLSRYELFGPTKLLYLETEK